MYTTHALRTGHYSSTILPIQMVYICGGTCVYGLCVCVSASCFIAHVEMTYLNTIPQAYSRAILLPAS